MGDTATLTVLAAGLVTVQDLGRAGQARTGVSPNGAADAHSARIANVLVGNAEGAALIEATASTLSFTVGSTVLMAVTGSADTVLVDGSPQPACEPCVVPSGARVDLPAPSVGRRTYVAINGEIEADEVLGSVAPDHLLGTGRRLRPGDTLVVRTVVGEVSHPEFGLPVFHVGAPRPRLRRRFVVDVTPGPDAGEFDAAVWDRPERAFTVTEHSDHVGLRLRGSAPRRTSTTELLSRAVPTGIVEVPPGGGLIVLLRGRFLTAGYPVLAVATTAAIDELGQAAPGDELSFRLVTVAAARATLETRETELAQLAKRVAAALAGHGLGAAIAEDHLGVVTSA